MFEEGVYTPWERDRTAASQALVTLQGLLSAGESLVSLGEFVLPAAITQLLGQVLAKSKAALDVSQRAIAAAGGRGGGDLMLIGRALRQLCEDGPVVCVIETVDADAGGLWADLVGCLRVASPRVCR